MITQEEYRLRREKLADQMDAQSAAIFFSSREQLRNGDVHYPFRQNSNFYYLTGFSEPDTVALLVKNSNKVEFILFSRKRNPDIERWEGPRAGQEGAIQQYGAHQAFDIAQLEDKIIELLSPCHAIYYELAQNEKWDRTITNWISKLQAISRKSGSVLNQLHDIAPALHEMRLIKSFAEISIMRKVGQISAGVHKKLMKVCSPGKSEGLLDAVFDFEVKLEGCRFTAYPTIVGSGEHACILHYVENCDVLKEGDLVLVDAGGEYQNYASDITRTFPVNGKFSDAQAAIYNLVLQTQVAVINLIKPGVHWNQLQELAAQMLTQGLINLGIIKSTLYEALDKKLYLPYYMHNIGHWLGLDVHDAGAYKVGNQWRPLEPGMVLTVEPGLYLSPSKNLDKKWWNIGIRIEDDVLVTAEGSEVLTSGAPKTIEEIETTMRGMVPA